MENLAIKNDQLNHLKNSMDFEKKLLEIKSYVNNKSGEKNDKYL